MVPEALDELANALDELVEAIDDVFALLAQESESQTRDETPSRESFSMAKQLLVDPRERISRH